MSKHPYSELKSEYESWVVHAKPRPECVRVIDSVAHRLTRPEALQKLELVFNATKIPVVVQAPIGERECGFNFNKNWGQGDSLSAPSRNVPRGRPPLGAPPNDHFPVSWEYAAIDAFTNCDHLNVLSVPAWDLAYACWKWEGYNGMGYRAHGRRTPYVLGGTNLQQTGKFTSDGHFDSDHMDTQLGCLPIAMRMMELVPSLSFGQAIASASIVPDPAPVPVAMGGGLSGTKWVQASLNVALHINPPLDVDGSFGRETRMAVRDFRKLVGLPDNNGLVDDAFCSAMDDYLAKARPLVSA